MLKTFYAAGFEQYFQFLLDKVGGEEWCSGLEANLARLLFRKFYWTNDIDSGISRQSLEFRTEAIRAKICAPYLIPTGEPSVLEVLICVALKVDEWLMFNPEYESRAAQFFFEIISVLGFDSVDESQIDERIDLFLDGKIRLMEGEFGANPRSPTLWEQVNAYYSPLFDLENADP